MVGREKKNDGRYEEEMKAGQITGTGEKRKWAWGREDRLLTDVLSRGSHVGKVAYFWCGS